MFNKTKYKRLYLSLINSRKNRELRDDSIYEKHHILPKAIWPQYKNYKWNIVHLTPKEHFIAHKILVKALNGKARSKMASALWIMMNNGKYRTVVTSKQYQSYKQEHVKNVSACMSGRTISEETINKQREAMSHEFVIYDPEGNKIVGKNLRKFSLDNGLNPGNMASVVSGKRRQYKGYTSTPNIIPKGNSAKHYRLMKDGEIIEIFNLKKFAKEQGIDYISLHKITSGKELSYRGYRKIKDDN